MNTEHYITVHTATQKFGITSCVDVFLLSFINGCLVQYNPDQF